ncbi:MAG: outer membrane protein assembly factor BamD [Candidatus Omnitrophica bacterium]|nr:outer membrane protein assembly factor BamD [Candidatus Omnitrophota bacterium]
MSRHILPLLIAAVLVGGFAPAAQAGWVWSPRTGWVGPGGAVKDTPEEQLLFANAFFERKEYKRARQEFQKLLKAYKESREAPEAQYSLGRCYEEEGDYYRAFKEYRKTTQVYPSSKRFDEVLEREYQIGNYFLAGKKRKLFGIAALLPARDKAVEIFQAIVDDGPFSEYGQLAQYKLGLAHLALQEYEPAVTAFEAVISRYPNSPLIDDARFQIAQASLKGTFKADYDQSPTDLAIRELDAFIKEYPESKLLNEATHRLKELKERRAQHEYQVGQFYERRRRAASALVYYQAIVERFSDTAWAPRAVSRLQVLQPRTP